MGKSRTIRMTVDEARAAAKLTEADEMRQDALTEADIDRAIASDADAPDFADPALARHLRPVPDPDVRVIRARLGMSQTTFAAALSVPVATIRDWEQARRKPSGPALTLLRLLRAEPLTMARLLDRGMAPEEPSHCNRGGRELP